MSEDMKAAGERLVCAAQYAARSMAALAAVVEKSRRMDVQRRRRAAERAKEPRA